MSSIVKICKKHGPLLGSECYCRPNGSWLCIKCKNTDNRKSVNLINANYAAKTLRVKSFALPIELLEVKALALRLKRMRWQKEKHDKLYKPLGKCLDIKGIENER